MKAIIPAAGIGKRLRPHTYVVPKVLLSVAGKPIIGHIIDELLEIGVDEITFIVGYKGEMVRDYIDSAYDIKAHYVSQPDRQGLGHAIWLARESHSDDSEVLIILGDTIFRADLKAMAARDGSFIAVKEVEDPRRFGIAELDDSGKIIVRLEEKPDHPKSKLAIVGIYLIRSSRLLFDCLQEIIDKDIRTKGEYQLTDGLRLMLEKGAEFKPFSIEGWLDCGKPETMLDTNRELLDLKSDDQRVEDYKKAYPDCIIRKPCYIGQGAKLHNAIIGPHVSIGEEAQICGVIARNSIIGNHAVVRDMILKDSIIGDNAVCKGEERRLNVCDSSEIE
jgi:glucose-1-phosphate thymidylyltransferase